MAISTYIAVPTLAVGDKLTASRWNTIGTALAFIFSPPECEATNTAGTSIPNNAETVIPFPTEDVDTGGTYDGAMHSTSTNNSRITITTAGRYDIDGMIAFTGGGAGRRVCNLRKNAAGVGGAGTLLRADAKAIPTTDSPFMFVRSTESLAVGDHLELFAFQTSGAALTLATAAGGNYLRARLIGS